MLLWESCENKSYVLAYTWCLVCTQVQESSICSVPNPIGFIYPLHKGWIGIINSLKFHPKPRFFPSVELLEKSLATQGSRASLMCLCKVNCTRCVEMPCLRISIINHFVVQSGITVFSYLTKATPSPLSNENSTNPRLRNKARKSPQPSLLLPL